MERPTLTDEEWSLVVELLERESVELPVEIRHTSTREFREQLRARLNLVDGLLARLHAPVAASG